jgi:hypothetical protein
MRNRIVSISSHLNCIESQFNMGGLSDGLYGEYANDVAIAFAYDLLFKLKEDGYLIMDNKEIYNLLNDGKSVEQIGK